MNNDGSSNSITNPDWEERLVDFAFGAMDPAAAAQFEQELAECRAHIELAQQYRSTIALMGSAVAPAEPLEGHKARFMQKLASTPQASDDQSSAQRSADRLEVVPAPARLHVEREKGRERTREAIPASAPDAHEERIIDLMQARTRKQASLLAPALAVAAAVALFLMGAWIWSLNNSLSEQESKRIAAEQKAASEQALRLNAERQRDEFARTLNVPPGYTAFPIQAQPPYTATATVLFNPDTKDASLLAERLEPLPPGKVYELWLLPSEEGVSPQAAGTFTPGAGGSARHTTVAPANVGSYAGFAVTLEDAPGAETPQGPMVLAGQFR